jgi:trans-2,3-dihydro-3-hydroxyanthranilate isomerase
MVARGTDMDSTRWVDFWLVDAFTDEPYRGNPAGVVLDATGLDADAMRLIAREVGASETAFVFPPTERGADLTLRWFTPTCEIPFCGHATIATLHLLVETGRFRPPADISIATLSGQLRGRLCDVGEKSCSLLVQTPSPAFEPATIDKGELAEALLCARDCLHPELPLRKDGLHLFVPLAQLSTLLNLYPDFRRLSRLGLEHEITGFACFTTQTVDPTSHWHLRFFAPGVGVNEDPVTGAAQGPMAVYLLEQGLLHLAPGETGHWVGEQGDPLERRGRVRVQVGLDAGGKTQQVHIGGPAVTVLQGRLRVA